MSKLLHFKLIMIFMLFGAFNFSEAQVVSGTVIDDSSQPLPGVSVIIKGTNHRNDYRF